MKASKWRRALAFALALIMCVSTMPFDALAEIRHVNDYAESARFVTETEIETKADVTTEAEVVEETEAAKETEVVEETEAAKETEAVEETEAAKETETVEETEAAKETETVEETETAKETETAEETEAAKETEIVEVTEADERSQLIQQIQDQINEILERFDITDDLTEDEIANFILDADEEMILSTKKEISKLEKNAKKLTEEEFYSLESLELFGDFVSVFNAIYTAQTLASKTVTVLDGQVSITDSSGNGSLSGNTLTITATGWIFGTATNTITITNETNQKAQLSFIYTADKANSFTIAGNDEGNSGNYTVLLESGAFVKIILESKSGRKDTTATLTLSDFSLVAAAEESEVTFHFDSANGSVAVNGTTVEDGSSQKISLTDGATLTAEAKGSASFLGWIDEENRILSTEAEYQVKPAEDMEITAVFAEDGGTPWFAVGKAATLSGKPDSGWLTNSIEYYQAGATYLYSGLQEAVDAASTSDVIVLMNNASLTKGEYTIPSGVTLLIPFDKENTLYTTQAMSALYSTYKKPTAYRTLTLADGAKLTVDGALSLSAKHTSAHGGSIYGGTPTGNVSFVNMQGNSSITLNDGGALYAYGYITGSGSVIAKKGSEVYELFQFTDFRGGNASTSMENGVFPLSQYYIQNIEVPLTIYSGAVEYAYTTVYMSSSSISSAVGFIADSDAMFNLMNGYVVKRYDGKTDRLVVEGYGDMTLSSINMKMGTTSINSKNYELPINSNITVSIQSGSITVDQDVALLPGAEVTVSKKATCKLGSGVSLYVYDAEEWGNFCGSYNKKLIPLNYAPGKKITRTEASLVDAKVQVDGKVDASVGYLYTTKGGANICGSGTIEMQPGTQEKTYQLVQNTGYTEIPLTSAQLHNADGSYTQTTVAGEYNCINGVWTNGCQHKNTTIIPKVDATCMATGWTEGLQCIDCGEILTEQTEISKKPHNLEEATCTKPAYCKNEGCTYVGDKAKGHTPGTEATCTKDQVCTVCGDVLVMAKGHDRGNGALCSEAGVCTVCGTPLPASAEHQYNTNVVEPTCTENGYTTYTCKNCGHSYNGNNVTATGHKPSNTAPCAENVKCTVCQEPIKATKDHEYEDTVVAPTCTEDGYTRHTCKVCEKTYDDTIVEALKHDLVEEEEFPATCTSDGHTAGSYCRRCEYVTWESVKSNGHQWVDVEAKNPTYTNVGWNAHKQCSVCKAKEGYEEIPVLDEPVIDTYDDFITNLELLEELAHMYVLENPGKDPLNLVIKYIRTGVDRYNSGSWGIMAGYEDTKFAKFVNDKVDEINSTAESEDQLLKVVGLKNIEEFKLPNGDTVDFGHMFGTMDITYHNNGSINHADVAGWGGDITDLLSAADRHGVTGTLEEMVTEIRTEILCQEFPDEDDLFSQTDMFGDLDGLYLMTTLEDTEYTNGTLTEIMENYFTESLTLEKRADFYLRNRLNGATLRSDIRNAVYNAYTGNKVIATLEGTREFTNTDLTELRKACCYAFADYICRLAGDYVDVTENSYYNVFSTKDATLAPGITQQIKYATTADNKQMVYYLATADITRDDVQVYANYNNNDPASGWEMQRVLDQANAAQKKYGDSDSEYYIPNYNVIASINASGYNMSTGEPSGLLVMNGVEYHAISSNGFFGILKDGTAVVGTTEEYKTVYKDQVQEGVEIFGTTLVKDGEVCVSASSDYYTTRASRTAVGITATGKVVMMVLDGRQEPFSCGGTMAEIAQIMLEAGCVEAVNLDGGGSTTYVAKQPGEDSLEVISRPSDGAARSVSSTLMMVSTAPSSTEFDHAVVKADYNYLTVGASVELTAVGISATGDAAQIPENAYWALSDDTKATITEDGVLTAEKLGNVTAKLMYEDTAIGSTELEIVNPNNVYFTKTSINAVYGQAVTLPVKALYDGKEVAVTAKDFVFSCNNGAGSVNGFKFTANTDSTQKNTKVTAALACNEDVSATITIALYNQGEVSFDFDQATGGDRQMAWDRVVSNATTEDFITYEIIDVEKPMVATYSFAIDMTQIPIPTELSDLVYMLPGADAADASAWGFLLQLAERISDLSEVKPVIHFDKNLDVDYSEMKLVNDYFKLTNTEFDEDENTLTLTLNWIKQTQAIDQDSANPLCIVSGIKLTPKDDAEWDAQSSLKLENSGEISYKIYMRASGLYSFAQKEENQKTYGLMPYINPKNDADKGGYFGDVYCTFTDTYTLVNALKEGWINELGGYAYYINGERLTGIQKVDDIYYDFGESGINVGQTKYTGLFYDEIDEVYRYACLGILTSGWNMIDNEWYYFSASTMAAVTGNKKVGDVYYNFEETGKLESGVWGQTLNGIRYYYGPSYYWSEWQEIDGEMYYFENGYRLTGVNKVKGIGNKSIWKWYDFGDNGIAREFEDGLQEFNGKLYYLVDGINQVGLQKIDGDYYFFTYNGAAVCGESYYAWETHCDLPCGTYAFGADGKMVNGLAEMSDGIYYYVNGKVVTDAAGLTKIGDDYYFISTKGKVATGSYYAWATNCDLPCGNYEFGSDGKMLQGIIEKEDGVYFCVNGKISGSNAGLIKVGDNYYFVASNGRCATGSYYAWATNCDLPCDTYEFGNDGKMLQGIVEKESGTYFYVNGKLCGNPGLAKIEDDYYFVASNGRCATGSYYAWATNCDLPCGTYEFGTDGKMLQGIVEKENGTYFYVTGKLGSNPGLIKFKDDYYFVASNGRCATGSYYAWATNCDLPCGTYEFGSDGKMLQGIVKTENGIYCYINGRLGGNVSGLTRIGDDYYFVTSSGKCATGSYYAWATNCDLPCGTYEFGDDGKMLNGFITRNSELYYYINGVLAPVGINYIDGYYYFVTSSGKLVRNCSYYAWETNGLLLEKEYTFDELGRIIA